MDLVFLESGVGDDAWNESCNKLRRLGGPWNQLRIDISYFVYPSLVTIAACGMNTGLFTTLAEMLRGICTDCLPT